MKSKDSWVLYFCNKDDVNGCLESLEEFEKASKKF